MLKSEIPSVMVASVLSTWLENAAADNGVVSNANDPPVLLMLTPQSTPPLKRNFSQQYLYEYLRRIHVQFMNDFLDAVHVTRACANKDGIGFVSSDLQRIVKKEKDNMQHLNLKRRLLEYTIVVSYRGTRRIDQVSAEDVKSE